MIEGKDGKPLEIEPEGGNGKPKETAKTDGGGHLASITVGEKEYKIVNSSTMIEIRVHKLDDGSEISQVVAHEFMMADHKQYMVNLLTEAINVVMRAKRRDSMVKLASQAFFNQMRRAKSTRARIRDKFKK